ncbi:Catenin-beta-like protein [Morchella snyderi]|nr:Catenin-beta-like protein [Morchella snyderi]
MFNSRSFDIVAAYKSVRLDNADEDGDSSSKDALPADFFDAPAEDEEGGRFFGGGVDKKQAEILDYVDEREREDGAAAVETIDTAWLRRTALAFEKKISKNAEMRGKFEDDPHKFMASEADLDADIKALSVLSEHPELFEEFRKLGCLGSLVGLLAHENTDIAIDAVEVISELTDDEVEAEPEQWSALVDGMVEAQLLEMLASNLERLNESIETDRHGVYHTLSVFENLASQQSLADQVVSTTPLLTWLLTRIQARESPISQNKQYAAELLAILLQSSSPNRRKLTSLNGVDILLQLLSPYRKRDPVKGGDEEEFVENIFDALTAIVDEPAGKENFVEAEGVELALLMLREGRMAKPRALRLLDHAVGGLQGAPVALRIVDAAGLKTLFGMFMKKSDSATTEHLLGVFAALLMLLPAESSARIRTLAKFVERDYEKIAKLLKLRSGYTARLGVVEREIAAQKAAMEEEAEEDIEDMREEWESRRLDAGLFCVQVVDLVLAWLCAEDDAARSRVKEGLGGSLDAVRKTLEAQIGDLAAAAEAEAEGEAAETRDMLSTLVRFL